MYFLSEHREYEDQMEGLKKENLVLRTENDILSAQLKDAETQPENSKGSNSPSAEDPSSSQTGQSLLLLTQNLKEAQKLYNEIKGDLDRLKQVNNKQTYFWCSLTLHESCVSVCPRFA